MDDWTLKPMLAAILALIVSLVCWMVYREGVQAGRDEVRAEWQADRIDQARARAAALLQARQREADLQTTIDQLRGEYGETIQRVAAERDALVRELRRRPERPAGYVPPAAQAAGAESAPRCSADQLYREDSEVVVRIAADADVIRASLMECRAAYGAAKGAAAQ